MSSHVGYVVVARDFKPHPNADRLQIATFFGNETCVSTDIWPGEIGIYFPSDLQLSEEYCDQNHLCRKTASGEPDTGYLDRDKRNVTAIKLRGYKSDGIFMPITSIVYTGVNLDDINVGDTISVVNGHEICRKYIPNVQNRRGRAVEGNRTRTTAKKNIDISPLFTEHADTEQLAYNMDAFKGGDIVEITLKMHGTSQRTGYLPVFKGYKRTIIDRILRREGTPIYDWGYVTGTRRTICREGADGFYGSNKFREVQAKKFEGKLHKGEEVYYEVVGYTDTNVPIMADCANKKLNDKDFVKQYGDTTRFSYGCEVGESDIYVYRMTMTNEDGDIVEYTPDFMRYRCEQMGVKTVPVFTTFILDSVDLENDSRTAGEIVRDVAERYYDGVDPIGKTHVREGVVCRIVNRPKFCAYKHKNWSFKCLEGIVKAEAEAPDMEEAEEVTNDEN